MIVVNEIHYKPLYKTERVEFIELYNPRDTPIELSGWRVDDAIRYTFPTGTILLPKGYLLISQDPVAFSLKYGLSSLGPFEGGLSTMGEKIVLKNPLDNEMDQVEYLLGFPWPTGGKPDGLSIQLMHPSLPNEAPANWRSGLPTPGQINNVFTENPPPAINAVHHSPQMPTSTDKVTIVAEVTDPDGLANVQLHYQIVSPGNYIRRHDDVYNTHWTPLNMQPQTDGTYQAELPAHFQLHRHLVRYRIQATDLIGNQLLVPYPDDPQPNFAYFVYDGLPDWTGAIQPGNPGTRGQVQTYDFDAMAPLPIYHVIAQKQDVADAQFMPGSTLESGYMGHDYLWWGTLVYGGQVYDHIRFRARGNLRRYATGKNMWKIDFNNGHWFQAYDNYGQPYATQWDKLNLSGGMGHSSRKYRGEHGLFESTSYRLFNLAGLESPNTQFVHFRVIDETPELGSSQYNHDFWGLYFAIEQLDGRFLDEHLLPDGNLYKIEDWTGELNNQGPTAAADKSDLNWFMHTYTHGNPDTQWWRTYLDLERYYSYRAIIEAVHHYDVNQGKNYFYYLNPATSRWSVHPWDLDITWMMGAGDGNEPFRDRVLPHYEFSLAYQNRMREIFDLLFNPEQVNFLINEQLGLIDTPNNQLSMVDADRALWDYNPIFDTRYVIQKRSRPGTFYTRAESNDFAGMVQLMRDWVAERRIWITSNILADNQQPHTPTLQYSGAAGNPADQLRFQPSQFNDPQGNHTFGAMAWRIAEINYPGTSTYSPNTPPLYEIDALWESAEINGWQETLEPPVGLMKPGYTYRVRVRMKDNSGRWSHWSAPVQLIVGTPTTPPPTTLKLTEIMYHPHTDNDIADEQFEFIELQNTGQTPIDLSHMYFEGIEYTFAAGTTLAPNDYLTLASNSQYFRQRYGFSPFDIFTKKLSNKGERITLFDIFKRTVLSVEYDDKTPWPTAPDGEGVSLVVDWPSQVSVEDLMLPNTWRSSTVQGGSPDSQDPLPVLVNEVWVGTGLPHRGAIELFNPTDVPADISHWFLSDTPYLPKRVQIPANTIVPANGYIVFDNKMYHNVQTLARFRLETTGDHPYLSSATESDRLTGYHHGFFYPLMDNDTSFGPYKTSDDQQHILPLVEPTLGLVNAKPVLSPLVIEEIMYNPDQGEEYIKITNTGSEDISLYNPDQPEQTWQIEGIFFQFPPNVTLAPKRSLLIVPAEPSDLCVSHIIPDDVDLVFGPYEVPLGNNSQTITLKRPNRLTRTGYPYVTVDSITYDSIEPWPNSANGFGASLHRILPAQYGNDVTSWQASEPQVHQINASAAKSDLRLCSFQAFTNEQSDTVEIHWVTIAQQDVQGFYLWYSNDGQRENADLLVEELITGPIYGTSENTRLHYTITESMFAAQGAAQAESTQDRPTYWLEAVTKDESRFDIAETVLRAPIYHYYYPIVGRNTR